MKRHVVCIGVILAFVGALLTVASTGCATGGKSTKDVSIKPAQRIRISGSNTCLPLLRILAKEFKKKNPDVEVTFPPGAHSSAGIEGVVNGSLEIGAVSRPLKPAEAERKITYQVLSNDGLVVAIHQAMTIGGLTSDQVKLIYMGQITNWTEVGGRDTTIIVLDRNEDESAKMILRDYLLGKDSPVTGEATVLFLETDMVKALESTPGAIGYLSLGYATSQKLPIHVLALDGVQPSVESIHDKTYRMVRPLGIVYKNNPNKLTKRFIDFVASSSAKKVMEENGYATAD